MKKKFIYILIIENILFAGFLLWFQPGRSIGIVIILIIPIIFVVNVLFGFLSHFLNKNLSKAFFIMSLVSILMVLVQFRIWHTYEDKIRYETYNFRFDYKEYELTLSKNGNYFSLLDRTRKDVGIGIYNGNYYVRNDTTYLINKNIVYKSEKGPFIYNEQFFNFLDKEIIIDLN